MHKQILALKDSVFSAILAGASDLSVCFAQPSLMALLLAMASFAVAQKNETGDAKSLNSEGRKNVAIENVSVSTRAGIAARPADGTWV
jgi:hypothetical protein